MDWIETWFGFSPDNGDGTAEWLIVAAALLIGVVVATWVLTRRRANALRLLDLIGLTRTSRRGPEA